MSRLLTRTTPATRAAVLPPVGGCLHLCNGLVPERDGGMVPAILGLAGALAGGHARPVTILTPTPSRLDPSRIAAGLELHGPDVPIEPAVRQSAIVHLHGLWQRHTREGARAARRHRVPYLIAAHGMADPWALRHKALKKRLYTAAVEGPNLRQAACLHALSIPEVDHLRAIAPRTPICLVPNGVDLRPFDALPPRAALEDRYPQLAGRFVLLFFGRLHVKKGLDLLAEALGHVAASWPELHLLLAGRDDGAWLPFRDRVQALGLADRITYLGHVAGASAAQAWAAADAFVLPSYSEGFPMAVLEALACRLPALITPACNFPEARAANAALQVPATVPGVEEGLRNLQALSPADRRALGARGRALVERRYTWERQAEHMSAVYHWILAGGPPPEAIRD